MDRSSAVRRVILALALAMGVTGWGARAAHAQYLVVFDAIAPADSDWAGDIDVGAQGVNTEGERAWNPDVFTAIASGAYLERRSVAVPDGAGGAIVIMQAAAREGQYAGDWEVIAQRVSSDGKLLWEGGERSVVVAASSWWERAPVAIPDGEGGALVFWEAEAPPGDQYAGDVDIRGQRISASGELLWGEDGVMVASAASLERAPCAVSDGAGGAIVVFQMGELEGGQVIEWDIAAQRVAPDGTLMWQDGERSVVFGSDWQETRPVAVSDGAGGALVFFEAAAPAGEYAGDIDVFGQRLSAAGELLWEDGDRPVLVHASDAIEQAPAAVPDGAGGAIVVCEAASRAGELAGDWQILARRISANGELLWHGHDEPTLVSATRLSERAPCALPDGEGGAFVVFEVYPEGTDHGGDADIFAQRVSADGEVLWSEAGAALPISSGPYAEQSPCIAPDGEGGIVVAFEVVALTGEYAGDYEVAAQRIAADGSVLWNDGERATVVSAGTWSERWPVLPGGAASGVTRGEEPASSPARPTTPGVNPVNPTRPAG